MMDVGNTVNTAKEIQYMMNVGNTVSTAKKIFAFENQNMICNTN